MRRIRLVLPVLLLAFAACPRKTAVWVAEGSTARELTLVVGEKRGRERRMSAFLRVDRCGTWHRDSAMWIVSIDTSRVTYGVPGPGARSQVEARPLVPGSYHAHMGGTGQVVFTVDSLGGVTALDSLASSCFAP
jgi:hypothetical protein